MFATHSLGVQSERNKSETATGKRKVSSVPENLLRLPKILRTMISPLQNVMWIKSNK